ncbi:MAG: class I SAM-dependent methyltransferase [Anaerolineales bacterium]|nr:class I SAM-dependent methyltransferase [Anaerolineales bacterium]MCL4260920.1 class I SAM-dependent methyltransferase [Anaerolineales bacterium]
MKSKRLCPICTAEEAEFLHSQKFTLPVGHPLSSGYDVVACAQCGFVFADTTAAQADYDKFYAHYSKYEDAKTGTGGVENPYDWQRQQGTARQIADFLNNPNASVLDVGCANGGVLKGLKELGYQNLCGVDPSITCVENTRRLGIEARQGSLFQPFRERAFDCIILSHTLEHVQDVQGAIRWIEDNLKPDGVIYLETPDASRYKDFLYAPFQDFNTEHINHFSLMCLENLMNECGFSLEISGTKNLPINADMFYPAVFGFWKKGACAHSRNSKKDESLRLKIEEYIVCSQEIMNGINARVDELLARKLPIILWGTGQLAMKLLSETSLANADILAFVDNNPINHGKVLHNTPIIAPDELGGLGAPILITTLLHHQAIAKQIKRMNLKNEIVFLK